MSVRDNLKMELRHYGKPPTKAEAERLTITLGEFEIEIVALNDEALGNGLYIRMDHPIGSRLAIVPHASNAIKLVPR